MSTMVSVTLIAALVLSFIIPWGVYLKGEQTRGRFKTSLAFNVFFFFGFMVIASVAMLSGSTPVMAETAETAASAGSGLSVGLAYIGAALVTGLSCIGGGIAVASAASAALGAISEDSSILGKSLIFVGLAEGVCLYGLIISFMILGKV